MHKSYDEILDLSANELLHWQVYYSMYPFDDVKDYLIAANTQSILYNSNRGEKAKALTPNDFMPEFLKKEALPTPEEIDQRITILKDIFEMKGKYK